MSVDCGCSYPYPNKEESEEYFRNLAGCYCSHSGVRSGIFNKCCSTCTGGCIPKSEIKCYQPYSSSQSFFLNNLKKRRERERCPTYIFPCGDPRRTDICNECNLCKKSPRITSFSKINKTVGHIKGAGSSGEFLNRMKSRQSTIVRGPQSSHSTLIRASHPSGSLAQQCVSRKNTDGTSLAMNRYPVNIRENITHTTTYDCCTEIPINIELGFKRAGQNLRPSELPCHNT